MKKLNEELFPGDEIEIESKVYKCIPETNDCVGCVFEYLSNDCTNMHCFEQYVILIEQPQVFKPTLLVVGESIEILGVKLLIKCGLSCNECVLNLAITQKEPVLCQQVDCETNACIISNEIVL